MFLSDIVNEFLYSKMQSALVIIYFIIVFRSTFHVSELCSKAECICTSLCMQLYCYYWGHVCSRLQSIILSIITSSVHSPANGQRCTTAPICYIFHVLTCCARARFCCKLRFPAIIELCQLCVRTRVRLCKQSAQLADIMVAFAGVLGCMSTCVSSPTMLICCTRVSCICNYVHLYLIQLYYLYDLLDLLDGDCFVRFACISFVRQTCDGLRSRCRRCACYCSAVPLNTHTHTPVD